MVADGADGRFRGRTYSNHPASGAAFTAEGNLYAEGSQERLRAPQATGDFWATGPNPRDAIVTAIAADTQEVGGATSPGAALGHERTKAANGSASMASSTAALPLAGWARANVPTGQIEVSQAAAQKAKSAISEAADRPRNCGRIVGRRKSCGGKSSWSGPVCSARRAPRCLVVTRPDLADRGLFVSLRPIAETQAGASLKH
jgi:hypothetical protein